MPSIRAKAKEWIKANKEEKSMTAETLERLYQVMCEMEDCVENVNVASVPVEQVDKWFQFLQFSVVKELTDKEGIVVVKEEEISNAIEKRIIEESHQPEHKD